jgi:hypothetical protein
VPLCDIVNDSRQIDLKLAEPAIAIAQELYFCESYRKHTNYLRKPAMSDFNYVQQRWIKQFEQLDNQILTEAAACQIRILDPGVIERVLQNDTLVCGTDNPAAFAKLRSLAMIHYSLWDKAVVAMGQQEAVRIMSEIRDRMRARYGDSLGGTAT